MCGIFGARWSWLCGHVRDPAAAVARALDLLRWRGPDGVGVLRCGDFVLGCARLSITEPRSRQPLQRRGGRHAGVLNGAITGARELWPEVWPGFHRTRLPNDAWLPLRFCELGQPQRLARLPGHRAAAVVDAQQDELVLARDAAGEKPLFVALQDGAPVAFASTVPALRALGVEVALPAAAVARHFTFGAAGPPVAAAPRQEILAELAGAHAARGPGGALQPVAAGGAAPAAWSLEEALTSAVARCLDAEGPLALCLSGGVDSTSLAVVAAGLGCRLPAYQFAATGGPGAERVAAAAVAAQCGIELRPVDGGPEVLGALPELTAAWGLPLGDPSVLAVHALARRAAGDGIRVLLSGEGADELLLGYARHRAARWLAWLRCGRRLLPRGGWSMSRGARLLRAAAASVPYASLLAVTPPSFRQAVLAADLQQATLPDALERDPLARARAVDLAFYLRWDLLPKLDVATMAAGVEGRCPFLDPTVVATALAMRPRAVLGKAPLRRAFARRLPAAVLRLRKTGFALPLDRWFRGELSWLDLLRESRTRQRPHLRGPGLDAAIDRHRRGAADLGHALYLVVAFELWLRAQEASACA